MHFSVSLPYRELPPITPTKVPTIQPFRNSYLFSSFINFSYKKADNMLFVHTAGKKLQTFDARKGKGYKGIPTEQSPDLPGRYGHHLQLIILGLGRNLTSLVKLFILLFQPFRNLIPCSRVNSCELSSS